MPTDEDPETSQFTTEGFFKHFQTEIKALTDRIQSLNDTADLSEKDRKDVSNTCLARIAQLTAEVADASSDLPAYDQRSYNQAIKTVQDKLSQSQAALAPKAKFSFKSKKVAKNVAATEVSQAKMTDVNSSESTGRSQLGAGLRLNSGSREDTPVDVGSAIASLDIIGHTGTYIAPDATSQQTSSTCTMSRVSWSCINLQGSSVAGSLLSLTINDVSSSLLLCGTISGPAHITNVRDTTIVLDCRQVRMHECSNVDVYLHCSSRPIIEDCSRTRFGPLPKTFINLLPRFRQQDPGVNLFDQVDDFKWLRPEPSPNWALISKPNTVPESSWQTVLADPSKRDVQESLKLVGIENRTDLLPSREM